jgi:hypothetical protein
MYAKEKDGFVSIWAGTMIYESYEAFRKEWIEEIRNPNLPDDDPLQNLSKFMFEYRVGWFDHDYQEVHYHPKEFPFNELIDKAAFSESYIKEVGFAADKKGIKMGNILILLLNYEYLEETAESLPNMPLKFIGCFPYEYKP